MNGILSLILPTLKCAYDYSPLVNMSDYSYNYRTLSVWECFEARGKFCIFNNGTSMISVTGSSNLAHGTCCKPNFMGNHCNEFDGDLSCSESAKIEDPKNAFFHTTN